MFLVLRIVGGSNSNFEHDAYESEELGSSDPNDSNEERGPRFERYRKEHTCTGRINGSLSWSLILLVTLEMLYVIGQL
jgi:hypothetical protein